MMDTVSLAYEAVIAHNYWSAVFTERERAARAAVESSAFPHLHPPPGS